MNARQFRLPSESVQLNAPNTRNQLPMNTSLPHPILIEQSRSYEQNLKLKGLVPPHIAPVPTHVLAPKRKASQFVIPNKPDEPLNLSIKQHNLNLPARSESELIECIHIPNESSPFPALHCEVSDNDVEMGTAPPKPNKRKLSLDNNAVREEPICLKKTKSDSIKLGSTVHEAVRSTHVQEKQIELYKTAHKITSKQTEPDDDVYMELGPQGTLVPLNEFKKIDWTNAMEATHDLLSLVFPLHVLETHGLSSKFMLPELDYECKSRPDLDDKKVYDIKDYVMQKTKMSSEAFAYIVARRLLKLAKAKGYNPFEIS